MAVDELEEARGFLEEALELLKQSGARWMMTALEHHAVLGGIRGQHERATALVGFTGAHRTNSEILRQRTEQQGYERLMSILTRIYESDELERRMSAGAQLTDEQALEHAAAISQADHKISAATAAKE